MMNRISIIACAAVLLASTEAKAQRPIELGVDAGAAIGLGDNSVTVINIPVQAFRIGFFFDDNMSLEPKIALNTITGSGETVTSYLFELGLLYHFYREGYGRRVYPPPALRSAFYVRPFAGIVGSSDGDSDTDGLLGIGIGMKVPLVSRLASRFEANFAHRFGDASQNQIGLLAGLSFFTR
jgi:outer membrane protein with beta-barrel domain